MPKGNRPYVIMQLSASIDGRIAFGPGLTMFDRHPADELLLSAGPIWNKVTGAIDAEWHPQGTICGSGTFLPEDAPLQELPVFTGDAQALYVDFLPAEVIATTQKWDILVDGRGRCRGGYKSNEKPGCHILHLVSHSASVEHLAFLRRESIPYLIGGEEHADLAEGLSKLYAKLGIRVLVLWGGGTLNGAMLRAGMIDEIHLIVWPLLIGGRQTPTLADCDDLPSDGWPGVFQLVSAQVQEGGHLWLHYKVTNT
jgi:2,5-diamino-6-(ribosylamino)-4(3H)-pyrimidinone 5'-phosphate reductase